MTTKAEVREKISSIFKPTAQFRWHKYIYKYEWDETSWIPLYDQILEQAWINRKGEIKWKEIDTFEEEQLEQPDYLEEEDDG